MPLPLYGSGGFSLRNDGGLLTDRFFVNTDDRNERAAGGCILPHFKVNAVQRLHRNLVRKAEAQN